MNYINRDKIKNRMAEINILIRQKIENLDITGGQRGIRNNSRVWNEVEKLKKELKKLNKILNNP